MTKKKERIRKTGRDFELNKIYENHPHYEVIDEYVIQKWNPSNVKNYTWLGYKFTAFGDEFHVRVCDLRDGSLVKVLVKCPLCPEPRLVMYSSIRNAGHTYCNRHARIIDLGGLKFGKLMAISYVDDGSNTGRTIWKCLCECGNISCVNASELLRGGVRSCGCLFDEYQNNRPRGKDNPEWNHVDLNCPVCGKLFSVKDSHKRKYKTVCCSVECKHEWQRMNTRGEESHHWSQVTLSCDNCGNSFNRVRYWANGNNKHHFCSVSCRIEFISGYGRGENHPQWTSIEVPCDYCGKWFYKKKNSVTEHNFCSREHFHFYYQGSNHPYYNENLSDSERLAGRTYPEYRAWTKDIYEAFGGRCVVCGSELDTVAHHLYSYAEYPEKRTSLDNGVVLCKTHHHEFHYSFMGGVGVPCTPDDFFEWIEIVTG